MAVQQNPDRADVVVVGAGAAGLAAAAALVALGADVLLVTDGEPGGDCTWTGCVPTKSLLEAAAGGLDLRAAVAHARRVVTRVARTENETALATAGIPVLRGRVRLLPDEGSGSPRLALAGGTTLRPRVGVVLATGSEPWRDVLAPGTDTSDADLVTTDGLLDALDRRRSDPRCAVVVGAGPSGVEIAQVLARLRAAHTVRVVERAPTALPGFGSAAAPVAASLAADGVDLVTSADPTTAPSLLHSDLVVLAAGRRPVLDVLGTDGHAGVDVGRAGITVDAGMRTSRAGVVAAGDVTGLQPSTHVAAATGRVAAATLLGVPATFDATWAPRTVYTDPEVAAVGELPGTVLGPSRRTVRIPFSRLDRALAADLPPQTDGPPGHRWVRGCFASLVVRLHADGSWRGGGVVAGALVVGPHAADLVSEVAVAGRLGLDVATWVGGAPGLGAVSALHPYPSWSWVWSLAADDLLTRRGPADPQRA